MEIDREIFARGVGLQINQSWVCTLNSDVILMVWFKNRRAKCRQQAHQQQKVTTRNAGAKAKPSKASPLASRTANTTPTNAPQVPTSSSSPPVTVKKEAPQVPNAYRSNNGNLTPLGSNTSSVITTPSPPITPSGSNPPLSYQHDSYNTFNWHTNSHNSSPHHYYGQNYNATYYSQMEYFNQQGGQNQMQMGNHMSGTYQMSGYPGGMAMGMATPHHQNFSPRHPDCSLDYMNQMV
ncbi:hypothetical protein ILUMI_26955 [Ignelater luminosus]|uniref:Homeobox domain-containing protein n=1 Tax=Ignelater luminosus TaxID=2038154 RepID=A0A8K0C7H9_IGNLU|nr:hypothetical protein ILUMI_26955 [Ignelater luminosus]